MYVAVPLNLFSRRKSGSFFLNDPLQKCRAVSGASQPEITKSRADGCETAADRFSSAHFFSVPRLFDRAAGDRSFPDEGTTCTWVGRCERRCIRRRGRNRFPSKVVEEGRGGWLALASGFRGRFDPFEESSWPRPGRDRIKAPDIFLPALGSFQQGPARRWEQVERKWEKQYWQEQGRKTNVPPTGVIFFTVSSLFTSSSG